MQKNVFCYDVSLGKHYHFILSKSICFHDVMMIVYPPRVFRNDITVATVTSPTLQPMSNTPPRQILNVFPGAFEIAPLCHAKHFVAPATWAASLYDFLKNIKNTQLFSKIHLRYIDIIYIQKYRTPAIRKNL